jgi:hypothetical protein
LVGTFAQKLDVPISEAVDLLAEFGVCLPLEYEDHLEGLASAAVSVRAAKR